ncbi:PEP-CTERM sorting domain-containing protein [Microcystis sp. 0824]|uniref:PEP-CTERM sorting domain-containing protein n=1 Tax=Microcystis sp. 0824 TaxID=1502726 RepID=UPI001E5ADE28|nr:PEP-CTERM sorting domain-containing protein [Microcystis sp. 0824]
MMTTNKLTKILSGVALLGIASAIAAPAQAVTLAWQGKTSSFLNDVKPGSNDTFSVTFSPSTNNPSPDNIAFITTATGVFNPEFNPAPQKYKTTTTATGNFAYSANQMGLATGQFRYELTSNLAFSFPVTNEGSGASVTWATGTTFIGFFETKNYVKFDVEDPSLPTVTGISPADAILFDRLHFYDRFNSGGNGFGNSRYDALIRTTTTPDVPEPGTILGLLTVGGLGLVSSLKKQK